MPDLKLNVPYEVSAEKMIAFARCYQLENWLRELVYLETKASFGTKYWEECEAALKRAKAWGIPPETSMKRNREHPHMSTPENDPLWFISFDALTKVLLDDRLWPLFEPYLTTKQLLEMKLIEVRVIRNRIAHARSLHHDDVERLMRVLKDLDSGLWTFCASYGDHLLPIDSEESDSVLEAFKSGTKHWLDIDVDLAFRSSACLTGGAHYKTCALYRFSFSAIHEGRLLDYQSILKYSEALHCLVAHIMLDQTQGLLTVTIPAVEDAETIIATAHAFAQVCLDNTTSLSVEHLVQSKLGHRSRSSRNYGKRLHERLNAVYDSITSHWPHYVVSPSHPYTFLNSRTPCSFLQI